MRNKEIKNAVRTKERYRDIKELRKAKKYDKIFELYGQKIYINFTPRKYIRKDIKELLKQGRFEDIYRKYGENVYNANIDKMQAIDIYNETGSKEKSLLWKIKNFFNTRVAPIALTATITTPSIFIGSIEQTIEQMTKENAIKYAKDISEYDDKIKEYAKEVNSMKLTDLQIFMKVMSDMWKEIDGYATPDEEVFGYMRLSLDKFNVGVCRHFADDVTAKLNAINPNYNARNISVYLSENEYTLSDIDVNIIETNDTVVSENNEENSGFDITTITGNHLVTGVDVPETDVTLILDATNPGIGVIKDGKIHLFSTPDGNGLETKEIGQLIHGFSSTIELIQTEFKSFLPCEYNLEELEEMYGTKAQNEALRYLEKLDEKSEGFIQKVEVDEKLAIKQAGKKTSSKEKIDMEK